jgi:hypothetical protein
VAQCAPSRLGGDARIEARRASNVRSKVLAREFYCFDGKPIDFPLTIRLQSPGSMSQSLTKGGAGTPMLIANVLYRCRLGAGNPVSLPYCAYCLSKMTA